MNNMDDKISVIWAVCILMISYMGLVAYIGDPEGINSIQVVMSNGFTGLFGIAVGKALNGNGN